MRDLLIVVCSAFALTACDHTRVPPAASGALPKEVAISYMGFGPAHWGASDEEVRQAWGRNMEGAPSEPGGCYYLIPQSPAETEFPGYRIGFMIRDARLYRIDVHVPDIMAPGGGRVGMNKAQLHALYPTMTDHLHKYIEGGQYLRVRDPQGGEGVVLFETDGTGKVTQWRVGVPPQVDFVERCG